MAHPVTDPSVLEPLADPYESRPLSASEDLRLLTIKPGQDDEEIVCDLANAAFGGSPVYEALSCAWGTNQKTHAVRIDRKVLPVTANLHAALRRLRLDARPKRLWVDAIVSIKTTFPYALSR
jgi:hypothetical protein